MENKIQPFRQAFPWHGIRLAPINSVALLCMPGSASTRPATEALTNSTLFPRYIFLLALIHRVPLVPEHCSSMPRTSALGICDITYLCRLAVCTQIRSEKTAVSGIVVTTVDLFQIFM